MMRLILLITAMLFLGVIYAQDKSETSNKEQTKTGFNLGFLPVVSYNTDIGFQYGALANIYHYGDGSTYPKYKHSLYLEWSRTTKGSGINQIIYDSDFLIPKTRVTLEASLLTEQALEFFGFNGYQAPYHSEYEDDSPGNLSYISRMYYKYARKQLKLKAEFQKMIWSDKFKVLFGYSYLNTKISPVDIDKMNKGKDQEDMLPNTAGLLEKYIDWGIIKKSQQNGGSNHMFRAGLVFDTRDQEANAMKGVWSEALLIASPAFRTEQSTFVKLALIHRQYFTLKKEILNLAYRVSYQPKISGEIPFYMLPFFNNSRINRDGLGGAKTLRGILRNRIVGDDLLLGNVELRWKFLRTVVFNQNLYLALHTFVDAGMVTGDYEFDKNGIPQQELDEINQNKEALHGSYGGGLSVVLNHNFVMHVNYGLSMSPKDGRSGFYINLNYLF